uniref:Uncharacterized protein n=1 Tax=Wuchereria bancrofti TaxID=6293 RepID=A0A1I8ET49_WUCBA
MNTLYMHFMQNRMLDLFKSSGRNLGAIKVSGKNMVQLIDDKISNELVELLVHELLMPYTSYSIYQHLRPFWHRQINLARR